jgi:hypothetical protein
VIELLLGPGGFSAFKEDSEWTAEWGEIQSKLSPAFAAQWFASGCS